MKKLLLVIGLILIARIGHAQIANWLIHPEYDDIELLDDDLLRGTLKDKIILWDTEGKKLLEVNDVTMHTFREDMSVLCEKGTNTVYGVVNKRGELLDLSTFKYQIEKDYPYFSCGYLLVRKGNDFYYVDKKGNEVFGPFTDAYPFLENLAPVKYVFDPKKQEEQYWKYISTVPGETLLENIDPKKISFCSSMNYGYGIMLVDKRFLRFRSDIKMHEPIHTEAPPTKKNAVMSETRELDMQRTDSIVTVQAKNAFFKFDRFLRLMSYQYLDKTLEHVETTTKDFIPAKKKEQSYLSDFEIVDNTRKFGLMYRGNLLLPPQFDKVDLVKGGIAVVTQDGKKGIVVADDESQIRFRFNNEEHIGFMHQFYTAKVSVTLPPAIECKTAVLMSKSVDCDILRETRKEYENVEGNTLSYDCRLSIPADLTDQLSEHEYSLVLKYDGLLSVDHKVKAMEWFVKYYDVNLAKNEFNIAPTDTALVEFNLVKSAMATDAENYFKKVEVVSPLFGTPSLTKLSENSFSFEVTGIDQEKVPFVIRITETGCPSVDYPFELTITKPETKKTTQRKAVKKVSASTVATPQQSTSTSGSSSSQSTQSTQKTTTVKKKPATPSIIMPM